MDLGIRGNVAIVTGTSVGVGRASGSAQNLRTHVSWRGDETGARNLAIE